MKWCKPGRRVVLTEDIPVISAGGRYVKFTAQAGTTGTIMSRQGIRIRFDVPFVTSPPAPPQRVWTVTVDLRLSHVRTLAPLPEPTRLSRKARKTAPT